MIDLTIYPWWALLILWWFPAIPILLWFVSAHNRCWGRKFKEANRRVTYKDLVNVIILAIFVGLFSIPLILAAIIEEMGYRGISSWLNQPIIKSRGDKND